MRDLLQIKEYLLLNNLALIEINTQLLEDAQKVEEKYEKELESNIYGYGLTVDFINSPFILEDEDQTALEKVEEIGGITVYKILNKNEEEKQWN